MVINHKPIKERIDYIMQFTNDPLLTSSLARQGSLQLITLVPALLYPWHIPVKNSSFNNNKHYLFMITL